MFLLASASPRRKDLLQAAGFSPVICPSSIEEKPWPGEKPESYALRMSYEKAYDVATSESRGLPVLAADTIVVLGDQILEKPRDEADAVRMLNLLSGQTHQVMTGICWITHTQNLLTTWGEVVSTSVTFHSLSDDAIARYVATGEPMDKAGAYAIQGGAAAMVKSTRGSYSNVVGLPMERVTALLKQEGILQAQGPGAQK